MIRQLLKFVFENKKFWLLPIIISLLLLSLLVLAEGTVFAPFIYTIF